MVCSKCGADVADEFKFCPHCGTPVSGGAAQAPAVASSDVPSLIKIASGTFPMGLNEINRKVTLTEFELGVTPVTQRQYEYIMGSNPSKLVGKDRPVECVNWCEALIYCNFLSIKSGLTPCFSIGNATDLTKFDSKSPLWKRVVCNFTANGYRLPTEAEWEYAARGGDESKGFLYAGSDSINDVAWCAAYDSGPQPVGEKMPNELGIYDMSGNVMEWCADWHGPYNAGRQKNPSGAQTGEYRIARGGYWECDPRHCTVTYRYPIPPEEVSEFIGMRLVAKTLKTKRSSK